MLSLSKKPLELRIPGTEHPEMGHEPVATDSNQRNKGKDKGKSGKTSDSDSNSKRKDVENLQNAISEPQVIETIEFSSIFKVLYLILIQHVHPQFILYFR